MTGKQGSIILERESEIKDPKAVICVVAEGKTENDYLNRLKDNYRFDNVIVDNMRIADKDILNRDFRDRMNLVNYTWDWMIFNSNGNCPLKLYISIVLANYYKCHNNTNEILDNLSSFRDELCSDYRINCRKYVTDGKVPKGSDLYKEIFLRCYNKFPGSKDTPDQWTKPSGLDPETCGGKQIYIMFDRDYNEEERDENAYKEVIEEIRKKNFHAVVTTPQFELWLMMHFKDASFDKIGPRSFHGTVESELGLYDIYEKSETKKDIEDNRFGSYYKDTITIAIERSLEDKRFVTDLDELENNIGTNFGLFLRDVLGIRNL